MGAKLLWLAGVFAGVLGIALLKGEPVTTALLVGGAFAAPMLVTLAMPRWVLATSAVITLGVLLVYGPTDDSGLSWVQLWLVIMVALGVTGVWTYLSERRKRS